MEIGLNASAGDLAFSFHNHPYPPKFYPQQVVFGKRKWRDFWVEVRFEEAGGVMPPAMSEGMSDLA